MSLSLEIQLYLSEIPSVHLCIYIWGGINIVQLLFVHSGALRMVWFFSVLFLTACILWKEQVGPTIAINTECTVFPLTLQEKHTKKTLRREKWYIINNQENTFVHITYANIVVVLNKKMRSVNKSNFII